MNLDRAGARALAAATATAAVGAKGVEVGVAPPACYIEAAVAAA